MGPLTAGTVDVGVFPEDLERASELLDDWPGRDAIVDDEDEEPPPETPPPSSRAAESTSPIALVLLVAAVGAMIAAWMVTTH